MMQILKWCMAQLSLDSNCMNDFLDNDSMEDLFEEEVHILLECTSPPHTTASPEAGKTPTALLNLKTRLWI